MPKKRRQTGGDVFTCATCRAEVSGGIMGMESHKKAKHSVVAPPPEQPKPKNFYPAKPIAKNFSKGRVSVFSAPAIAPAAATTPATASAAPLAATAGSAPASPGSALTTAPAAAP